MNMNLKYLLIVVLITLFNQLLASAKLNSKTYRGRTNGYKRVSQYPERMEEVMFQYDFLTPQRLQALDEELRTTLSKEFSSSSVSVFITPHEKPFNPAKWHIPNTSGLFDLATDIVTHKTAIFNPLDENFKDVYIIDKKIGNVICTPQKTRRLAMNQALVNKFNNIIDRDDYRVEKYNKNTIAAIAEFPRSCFTNNIDRKLRIVIRAVGTEDAKTGNHKNYVSIDTLSKKLIKRIASDFNSLEPSNSEKGIERKYYNLHSYDTKISIQSDKVLAAKDSEILEMAFNEIEKRIKNQRLKNITEGELKFTIEEAFISRTMTNKTFHLRSLYDEIQTIIQEVFFKYFKKGIKDSKIFLEFSFTPHNQSPELINLIKEVQAQIKNNWNPKKSSKSQLQIVRFDLDKNGYAKNLKFLKSNVTKEYNKNCIAAINAATPFDTSAYLAKAPKEELIATIEFSFDYNVHHTKSRKFNLDNYEVLIRTKIDNLSKEEIRNIKILVKKLEKNLKEDIPNHLTNVELMFLISNPEILEKNVKISDPKIQKLREDIDARITKILKENTGIKLKLVTLMISFKE